MTKEKFLHAVTDWENHRVLLWYALQETEGPVVEMGCGGGSTPALHEYCVAKTRPLFSFENDIEWAKKFHHYNSPFHKVQHVKSWDEVNVTPSVILIDHAPGERRIVDVEKFKDIKGVLVLHDTQPQPTAADYKYEKIWPLFKYRVDLKVKMNEEAGHNRTWASAVSNHVDVTRWRGLETLNPDYSIV